MTATTRRRVLLGLVPLLAVLAGLVVWASGGQRIETDNAYLKSDLVPIHPEVDAQVTEVLVEENSVVQAGQTVIRLDVASLKIELERAEARLATVREDLLALERQYRQRRDELALAEEQRSFAERELARQRELVGAKLPAGAAPDSFSVLPALRGAAMDSLGRPAVVLHSGAGHFAIRRGPWKLICDGQVKPLMEARAAT